MTSSSSSLSSSLTKKPDEMKMDKFIDNSKLDPEFRCFLCKEIMLDVYQADDCGCRYCSKCLEERIIRSGVCAQCNRQATNSKIPDKYFSRKIRQTIVKCEAKDCQWSGKIEDMCLNHYKTHKNEEQIFKCLHCARDFECKAELEKHLDCESGDCKKQPFECPYKSIGCDKVEIKNESGEFVEIDAADSMETDSLQRHLTRETFPTHLEQNLNYHLKLLMVYTNSKLQEYDEKLRNFKLTPQTDLNSTQQKSTDLVEHHHHHQYQEPSTSSIKPPPSPPMTTSTCSGYLPQQGISVIDKSTPPQQQQQTSSSDNKANIMPGASVGVIGGGGSDIDIQMQQSKSRVDMLQTNYQNLLNDLTRLAKSIDTSKLENRILKENLKEVKQMAQELHKTLALNQVSILALEERLINLEKISYEGVLLWKITNVAERIQEAKSGRQTSFYSPPFYTSRNGYKMCVRVYLNGDGNGRNTHLSLFFVILRGEFDALLRWPFRQKVTFVLIDQAASESKENVYDAFRPDPNSSSFKRPTSDMNIASGLPIFCPLGKLMSSDHEYIKDNTLFIKTIVDINDLPTV